MNIYVKWFFIVGLNSVLGFLIGHERNGLVHNVGMVSGVFTWYLLYLYLDIYLLKTGRQSISRRLFLSALLRIPLQFVAMVDMYAGLAAIFTVDFLGLSDLDNDFINSYSKTMFTGLYLSVICSVIYLIISGIDRIRKREVNA